MMDEDFIIIAVMFGGIGALLGLIYLVMPLIMWRTYSQQAEPEIIPFDPATNEMPPDVRAYFTEHHERLLAVGFQYLGTYSLPRFQSQVLQVVACYARPADRVSVHVIALHVVRNGVLQNAQCFPLISSNLSAGRSWRTTNYQRNLLTPRRHKCEFFPQESGLERLIEIHAALLAEAKEQPDASPAALAGFEKYLTHTLDQVRSNTMLQAQDLVNEGTLFYSPDRTSLHFTLPAAYRCFWSILFPANWIIYGWRVWRARRREQQLVAGGWLSPRSVTW